MTKPTPQEVTAYAKTIDFVINGEQFCDFYESKGWKIGASKMVSWKAAVRTWKSRQGGFGIGKVQSKVGSTGGFVPSKRSII